MKPQEKPKKSLTYAQKVRAGIVAPKPRQAMKRSSSPAFTKPRKRLRKVSKANSGRMASYHKWIKTALAGIGSCQMCGHADHGLEPHHPSGRGGDHLFEVVAVCHFCHQWIHEHANKAYDMGWLQPPIRGRASDPSHPKPFELVPIFERRYEAVVSGKTILHTDDLDEARRAVAANLDKSQVNTINGDFESWSVYDHLKMALALAPGDIKQMIEDEEEEGND